MIDPETRNLLDRGTVIPAMPLALNASRKPDERRQRALLRYYLDAGAGGLAAGVHTTQFAIREHGLFRPVLALAAEEIDRFRRANGRPIVQIGGICGRTNQALEEAQILRDLGYHAGLLSLAAFARDDDETRLQHCRTVAETIPLVGFYLQTAVGGSPLSFRFWREFAEIPDVVAVKIAPFDRYRTLDVVRAIAESGRDDIALYTGNDDAIVHDLLTPFRFHVDGRPVERRIVGGLLGHWSVWTRKAVELLDRCHAAAKSGEIPTDLLRMAAEVTDCNAALFDAANGFAGCIAGLHEVLRRQGLLEGTWCLDPSESLGPGQSAEIDRVCRAYPHLQDDAFVAEGLGRWLGP